MGCYFCGSEDTGVEHIPPKCFFPEGYRERLITVPSCDEHNQEKSKDDEYVRAILLNSIDADNKPHLKILRDTNLRAMRRSVTRSLDNIVTKEQAKKVLDIIEEFEGDPIGGVKAFDKISQTKALNIGLMGLVNKATQKEVVFNEHGEEILTASFEYDTLRFNSFLECLARGLFFYELDRLWEGKVNILPHSFLKLDAAERDKELSSHYLQHMDKAESKGAQKDYFYYDGFNELNPITGKLDSIFFNFCIFDTFKFTAIFLK